MGHMLNVDQGASGLVNETDVNRRYTPFLHAALNRCGIKTLDCTPNAAVSLSDSLCKGVDVSNSNSVDLFISCHVNAFYNEDAHGCEVIYYPNSVNGKALAESIVQELAALGFTNRGTVADTNRGLYELKATDAPAVIIEPFFCTSSVDVDLYRQVGDKAIGEAIAKGICTYLGKEYILEKEENLNCSSPNFQVYNGKLEVHFNNYIGIVDFSNLIKKG